MIEIEHVDFISIPTRDLERAKRFYGKTLGLELETGNDRYAEFRAGQVTLSLWNPEQNGMEFRPNSGGFALRVADVEKARAELESAGVEFSVDTIDSGVCHMAPFRDPDGNAMLLHRRYAP